MIIASGYNVITADNPETAMNMLENVNCVITDYNMPNYNGAEFITMAKQKVKFIPFIMLTSESSFEILENARKCGAATILNKPVNQRQLLLMLNTIVGEP